MTSVVLDLDAAATLAAVESGVAARRQAAVEEVRQFLHWAGLHSADPQAQPGAVPVCRGGDLLVALGGEGTPAVQELCWGEFAIARQAGVVATEHRAGDCLDLAHRLPFVWAAVQDLRCEAWVALKVARMSRRLSKDAVGVVDVAVAAAVDQAPSRILAIAEAKVIEADLDAHRARIAADDARIGVHLSRPRAGDAVDDLEGEPGTRRVTMKLPTGTAVEVDATITGIADLLHTALPPEEAETVTRGRLEAMAVELLADPRAAVAFLDEAHGIESEPAASPNPRRRRTAVLHVHLSDLALTGVPAVARVEGLGPMLLEQLPELFKHRDLVVQPVIDLNRGHAVTGYEHPTTMKTRSVLRMLGDVFPHSTTVAYRTLDHDHVRPYVPPDSNDDGGPPGRPPQTRDDNTAPLTRRHHRLKTHAGHQLTQLDLAVYRWVTPHGLGRLVTTTGTRTFTPVRDASGAVRGEIYDG